MASDQLLSQLYVCVGNVIHCLHAAHSSGTPPPKAPDATSPTTPSLPPGPTGFRLTVEVIAVLGVVSLLLLVAILVACVCIACVAVRACKAKTYPFSNGRDQSGVCTYVSIMTLVQVLFKEIRYSPHISQVFLPVYKLNMDMSVCLEVLFVWVFFHWMQRIL